MTQRIITCAACGEERPHKAHGWCGTCYARWLKHGKPEGGPPKPKVIECGTVNGWDRHMRERSGPCPPCRNAHNTDVRNHYRTKGKQRQYTKPPPEWDDGQRRTARHAALAGKSVAERRLFLEAIGLVPSDITRPEQEAV